MRLLWERHPQKSPSFGVGLTKALAKNMIEEIAENRRRFERQRRNLIIISIVVISYNLLNLKLTKINILGNEFHIENQENINVMIWSIFLYFVIRYTQYYMVINNKEFMTIVSESMHKYIPNIALKQYRKEDIERFKKENPDAKNIKYTLTNHTAISSYSNIWDLEIYGTISWELNEGAGHQQFKEVRRSVYGIPLFYSKIKAKLNAYIKTPHITEYLFPYALSLFSVVIGVLYS